MSDSYISTGPHGTTLSGPDATECFRAAILASSLRLWAKTKIIPTRGVTITRMLAMATRYTGRTWQRSEVLACADAVSVWVANMQAGLPDSPPG